MAFLWLGMALSFAQASELTTLVYHDVVPDPGRESYSVSRSLFVAQMDYLRQNGYHPISLDLLAKASQGKTTLPEKPVLLTFDDALRSYAEFVVPLLKIYGFPSVVSVVGAWADGSRVPPEYQGKLMTWEDLRKLRNNPSVEIISHSHDLHRGIPSNPQGNEAPATITRRYDVEKHRYESETEFRQRIRDDLTQSVSEFRRHMGFTPRAIAWPYGYYDQVLVEEKTKAGIHFYLTLENGPTSSEQLPRIKRTIMRNTTSLASFVDDLQYKYRAADQRVVEFSLDAFMEQPQARQEELLSRLLDRLQLFHATTVVMSPFTADRRAAFFFNRQVPVTADVLNRILHQILTRLRIQNIYLRLPASLPAKDVDDLYADLARLNWFSGVVFETPSDPEMESRLRRVLTYFNPVLKFGADNVSLPVRNYDFSLLRMDPGLSRSTMEAGIENSKKAAPRVLVLLDRSGNVDDHELAARLHMLRELGVNHYGYSPDDYVASKPAFQIVAPEMSAKLHEAGEK